VSEKKQAKPNKKPQSNKSPNDFIQYSGMAIKMGVVIMAGVLGGQYLDEKFQTESPWITIIFSLLSVAIAIYIVIKDTSR